MAKKKTPAQLREEARKLMEQAQEEERARHEKIGEMFVSFMQKRYAGFDLAVFKEDALRIWQG